MLAVMIERAKIDGQVKGVVLHLVDGVFLSFNMSMTLFYLWNMTFKKLEIWN
jgi:hypothetical protein